MIDVVVRDETTKGPFDTGLKIIKVAPEKIRAAIEELRAALPADDDPADGTLQRWRMHEIELSLELSAEGGVQLVGTATAGVTGGIKVKFHRTV